MSFDGNQYLNAFINNSATIRDILKDDVENAPHKAVKYGEEGTLEVAGEKEVAVGLILSDAPANDAGITPAGAAVDVLIKDIGIGIASSAIKKGELVTTAAAGKLAPAASGDFVFGMAMTAAESEGDGVQIQIIKGGPVANP